jgi:hypothetical protein
MKRKQTGATVIEQGLSFLLLALGCWRVIPNAELQNLPGNWMRVVAKGNASVGSREEDWLLGEVRHRCRQRLKEGSLSIGV